MKYIVPTFIFAILTACAVKTLRGPASISKVDLNQSNELSLNKKTVCALTVNSTDEIDGFANYFSPDLFQIIELVDGSFDQEWGSLRAACERKVSCDVLVVSGHFAGHFFGKKGRISLEEMEASSCDSDCSGIFRKPKEVFLFGCNTLAGKNKDSRTPAEYRRVLIADGFTPREADQVVAYRYSPVGFSFNARIRRLFPETPAIYGFSSKAPLGNESGPRLRSYVKQAARNYDRHLQSLSQSNPERNHMLLSAFSGTSMVQELGDRTSVHACTMLSKSTTMTEKFLWVEGALTGDDAISNIPLVESFFTKFREETAVLSPQDEEILQRIRANSKNRDKILALLPLLKETPRLQLQILNLMKQIRWMDQQSHRKNVMAIIGHVFKGNFTQKRRDYLRSVGKELVLELSDIPVSFFRNFDFLYGLRATRLADPEVIRHLIKLIQTPDNADFIQVLVTVLAQSEVERDSALAAIRAQFTHRDQFVRKYSYESAVDLAPDNQDTFEFLVGQISKDTCSGYFSECDFAVQAIRYSHLNVERALRLIPFMLDEKIANPYLRNVLWEMSHVPTSLPEKLISELEKSGTEGYAPLGAQTLLITWLRKYPQLKPRGMRFLDPRNYPPNSL